VKRLLIVLGAIVVAMLPMTPALAAPGPPSAPEWWFDSWNVPSLWAQGADGRGITIAEIDSGVSPLPQFAGKLLVGTDYGPKGGNGQTDHEIDPFGHGTAMASIMVAASGPFGIEGTAPGAQLLPIAVPLDGSDDAGGDDHLADAIRYAADHGAKIINMSIGEPRDPTSDPTSCDPQEQLAITYAVSKGIILLAAGGNSGLTDNAVEDPGVCIGVVSVGAVDSTGTVATFSSRHEYAALVAPGVNIPTLGRISGSAFHGEGTSQATAVASAAVALVWSKYPTLTGEQVLARIFATLDNPHPTRDQAYGFGEINPLKAITATVPASATEPVRSAAEPYVAVQVARAAPAAPAPAPVAAAAAPPGHFVAGSAPSRITRTVIGSAVLAVAGLLALIVLATIGAKSGGSGPSVEPDPPQLAGSAEPVQGADHAAQRGLNDRFADPDPPQHPVTDFDL
jgi:Subtilase family